MLMSCDLASLIPQVWWYWHPAAPGSRQSPYQPVRQLHELDQRRACVAAAKGLMRCADALAGCTEGSEEEAELETIIDALEAYKIKHWPLGKEPGGKG